MPPHILDMLRLTASSCALAAALVPPSAAQCNDSFVQSALVHPRAGTPFSIARAGNDVLHLGDEIILASASTTTPGASNRDGAVLTYERSGSGWTRTGVLTIPSPGSGGEQQFGDALASAGDVLVITASGRALGMPPGVLPTGAAFTYRRVGSTWNVDPTFLTSPTPSRDDLYGNAVATNGAWIAVGARLDSTTLLEAGAVHLYEDTPSGWQFRQTLTSPSPLANAQFGTSVAMTDDVLAVGEPRAGSGRVEIYRLTAGAWSHAEELASQVPGSNENFGVSVDLDQGPQELVLAVGAPASPPAFQGAVVLYETFGGGQSLLFSERFDAPFPVQTDRLGCSIAVDGDVVVSGACFNSPSGVSAGGAHVFRRTDPFTWECDDLLFPSEARASAAVGSAVDVEGGEIVVCGTGFQFNGQANGGCWTFERMPEGARLFGFGDGATDPCPCGNETATVLQQGCENLSGVGGSLFPNGTLGLGADDLELDVRNLNGANLTILFSGTGVLAPAQTIGNGLNFCLPPLRRLGVESSDAFGIATFGPGLVAASGWSVGQTLTLQAWYRDPNAACVSTFNATGGVELTILP